MKNIKHIAIAILIIASYTTPTFAQETTAKTAGYDLKKNVKCRVIPTETGCSIVFIGIGSQGNDGYVGKKGYDSWKSQSAFSVSSSDNSVTKIVSPRDPASGLPTGKRMHKPMPITKELDKSSPTIDESVSSTGTSSDDATVAKGSGGGSGKASFSDLSVSKATFKEFTVTKRCNGKSSTITCVDGECDIPLNDCPNGTCDLLCSWSWGVSNTGSTMSSSGSAGKCSVNFLLEIENGGCTGMAINEKGLPGGSSKKTTK